MTRFRKYRFSDFVNINPAVKLKANEPYSFIEMKDLNDGQRYTYPSIQRTLTGGSRFEEGDTLFARITPCLENGKICQAKGLNDAKGFGSTEFLIFRGKEKISDPNFVFYLSRWDEVRRFAELNLVGTSGRQRVPKDVFENLELELPEDVTTQIRIASILSSLDDKIELNRRTSQTLEQIAQTLFKKYFVDDIDPENLPEGWQRGKLGNLLTFRNGKSSPIRHDSSTIPVYGSNGIIGYCETSNSDQRNIIIGRVGSFCGSLYYSLGRSYVTDNAIIAEAIFDNSSTFCYLLLKSLNLNSFRGGSGQPLINQTVLSGIDIIVPDITIINEYEIAAYSLYQKIFTNETENSLLSKIRDSILPKLMSGEIEVNVAEKELAEI